MQNTITYYSKYYVSFPEMDTDTFSPALDIKGEKSSPFSRLILT